MSGRRPSRNDRGYWWKVADFSSIQKINSLRFEEKLNTLSNTQLFKIYRHLDLTSLGNLALTAKMFAPSILKFVLEEASMGQILYCFVTTKRNVLSNHVQRYLSRDLQYYRLYSPSSGKKNFKELGNMVKRLTMLKATGDRLQVLLRIINNFSLIPQHSNKEVSELFGVFLHTFMRGWFEGECEFATNTLMQATLAESFTIYKLKVEFVSVMQQVQEVLVEGYTLGDDLEKEKNLRNFLHAIFYPTSSLKLDAKVWLQIMLRVFVPTCEAAKISKLLLLTTAPIKKSLCAKLQWQDNAAEC
jgi:hypothetical protein